MSNFKLPEAKPLVALLAELLERDDHLGTFVERLTGVSNAAEVLGVEASTDEKTSLRVAFSAVNEALKVVLTAERNNELSLWALPTVVSLVSPSLRGVWNAVEVLGVEASTEETTSLRVASSAANESLNVVLTAERNDELSLWALLAVISLVSLSLSEARDGDFGSGLKWAYLFWHGGSSSSCNH